MAELPAVIPGEPVDSTTFGNPVIDRVLSRYADAADRDLKVPTPQAGDFAFLVNISATQVFDGVAWSTLAVGAEYVPKAGGTFDGAILLNVGGNVNSYEPGAAGQLRNIILSNPPLGAGDGQIGDQAMIVENTGDRGIWYKTNATTWVKLAGL